VKLENTTKIYLKELIVETIENIELSLAQSGINEDNIDTIIEQGNYELDEVKCKLKAFKLKLFRCGN
jgi:ribosomal protein L12E/L44/L45/RPP1/RPP2